MNYKPTLSFPFQLKTKIIYGAGSIKEAKAELEEAGMNRVLIITDRVLFEKTNFVERLQEILGSMCIGVFSDVEPDTGTEIVEKGAEVFKEKGAQGLISIGGGSVIDTAKGISAVVSTGVKINELVGMGTVKKRALFHLSIPTTAGTGSEVTSAAVIKDKEQKRKLFVMDINLTPDIAILDPELTLSLPPSLTAYTGIDTLTHSIEALSSRRRNPISDALALHSIRLVFKNLEECVKDGSSIVKRGEMLIAAALGGAAFNFSMVGVVHALAHTVGALYGIPHGLGNAIFLIPAMKYNLDRAFKRYAVAGEVLGLKRREDENDMEVAEKFLSVTKELIDRVGIPVRLRDNGVSENELQKCAELAMTDPCIITNPKTLTSPEEVMKILKEAW